ncbi:MAG: AraC family transcriptional regulator [Oscillospiraceae bacterium]|nr:AraC family transcriptional regulator [Oscillospiraceae bacterium]
MREPMFQKTKQLEITLRECDTPNNMKRQHYHDGYEIYLQLGGERCLTFGGEEYTLTRGSLFVVTPFVLHMTMGAENPYFKRYLLNLSPLALSEVMRDAETDELFNGLRSCMINLDDAQLAAAYNYFEQIHRYAGGKSQKSKKLMQMSAALFVDFIASIINGDTSLALNEGQENINSSIHKAVAYINANYEYEINLDFISDYVHMSKSNFCLVFKKTMGETFVNYLNAVRLSQAHKLLSSTDMRLNEIAAKTGFSSADYMSRIFKRTHGVSPSELKRKEII